MFRLDAPEGKAGSASAWSPPLVGDFHALDKFGEVVFGDEKGNRPDRRRGTRPAHPPVAGKDPHGALKQALTGLNDRTPGEGDAKKSPPPAARSRRATPRSSRVVVRRLSMGRRVARS